MPRPDELQQGLPDIPATELHPQKQTVLIIRRISGMATVSRRFSGKCLPRAWTGADEVFASLHEEACGTRKRMTRYTYQIAKAAKTTFDTGLSHCSTFSY